MTANNNQDRQEPPTPAEIAAMANTVATYLQSSYTPKKHGGYAVYRDGVIQVSLDTFVPNVDVSVIQDGKANAVFTASYTRHHSPERYNPGEWTKYLAQLATQADQVRQQKREALLAKATAQRQEHYAPIDDVAVFSGLV